jgi:outer membrane protein assembly factor BamB
MNYIVSRIRSLAIWIPCVAFSLGAIVAQVITSQADNARTGANTHETILTPANVNVRQFGKAFALKVDGGIYAQPLYVPHLAIPGRGSPNVLFVATENDSVYAFDADGAAGTPLWHASFLKPDAGITTVAGQDAMCPFIQPGIGITPTPVIDPQSGTLYVLARTSEGGGMFTSPHYSQKLHALSLTSGQEKFGGPVEIKTPGFDALRELPRAALLLVNGQVILTWASSCDVKPYHGWVMAYDQNTLKQTSVFNTSPDAGEAGIWQSDNGPAADAQGNIFVATGNGKFTLNANGRDYGDSLLKLGVERGNLAVRDYFTPAAEKAMNSSDQDLGSGGPILLPDQPGPHPRLVLIGGKNGVLFVLDRDHLGHYQNDDSSVIQAIHSGKGIYAAPAYWNGHVYVLASDDSLADFVIDKKGTFPDRPAMKGSQRFANPGATPAVSANGARNGIVWLIETKVWNDFSDRIAVLHAYDANNVAHELYNSEENSSRDRAGAAMRFTTPTIANGHVYVGAKGEVDVYTIVKTSQ